MTKLNRVERAALEDLFVGLPCESFISRMSYFLKKLFYTH
jgi:hypothetical protein